MAGLGPILPPATIGVLGGGQLGRYAVIAATTMGYRTIVLDPDPSAPAGAIAGEHLVAPFDDERALRRLTIECEAITTEFENPPSTSLDVLADAVVVAPPPSAVRIAQDRIAEKAFLSTHGFPVGPWAPLVEGDVAAPERIVGAADGAGAIIKTARLGYDGKGQRALRSVPELHAAWAELGGVACIVEARLELVTELSVIVVRGRDGSAATYPIAENRHVGGILDLSVVPAHVDDALIDLAEGLGIAIADALGYVGVLAVELFVVERDEGRRLLVNELAPRPHNSGHWTLDASATSQYEQQIRMLCGLGVGATGLTVPSIAMVNLLGDLWADGEPDWAPVLADPHAKLHLYGKGTPRPGRKMGHLTVTSPVASAAAARALELRAQAVQGRAGASAAP
jgi:5-(carboxyamino)imidazole ribonucleotide synthase